MNFYYLTAIILSICFLIKDRKILDIEDPDK